MHYLIDGYNLLFRLLHGSQNLQSEREMIIHDLNKKISLINLEVSIVFDAAYQVGGRSRSHYDALEILFTAERESADEYILEEIQKSPAPQRETVVTSDKKLAQLVRHCSAHTESVEEFIQWLNRSYKNKLRQLKKDKHIPVPITQPSPPTKEKSTIPPKEAPLEALEDYYTRLFEAKWQELQKMEQKTKDAKVSQTLSKRPPRKPRQKKDPFQASPTPESQEATEMERWLKIFQQRPPQE